MTTQYIQYPISGSGSIPVYSTFSAFPASATANSLAIAADTGILYEYFSGSWIPIGGPGSILSIGTLDGQAPSANGASIVSNLLYLQSASATAPGLVNLTTQSFAGNKTFTGNIGALNLAGTNTGDQTITLTGGVTGSGTGSFAATVVTNANLTGPITSVGNATSVTNNSLTNAMLAQMPTLTLKGNNTGGTANALDLTVAQVQSLLSIPSSASPLSTLSGGTGISHTYTPGSVIFVDASGFLNEDHTNFNWDDNNLRLSLGGHLSTAALGVSVGGTQVGFDLTSTSSNTAVQISNQGAQLALQFSNATNSATQGAAFGGAFSRGTTSVRLQSLAGDQLTTISAQGYTGSAFGPGFSGAIAFVATENTTASHNGGELILASTPNGTTAPVAGLVLGQNQLIQLPAYTTAGFLHNDASGNITSIGTTGTGNVVLATSPTLITPALGTPTALVGTNITGTATAFTASNVTTNANLTGPITSVGNATSVTNNSLTNAMLAQMATLTLKGNNTGGTANAADLTVAQVNAILPIFTSLLNGLVPLSGGGTTNYLRADGSWAAPAAATTPVILMVTGIPANASANNPIIFPTVTFDTNSGYNASTGQYTAPFTGFYQVSSFIDTSAMPSSGSIFSIYVNNSLQVQMGDGGTGLGSNFWGSGLCYATVGQVIDVRVAVNTGTNGTSNMSLFMVH